MKNTTANAAARRIIRFTKTQWNPAQLAAWNGEAGAVERFAEVSAKRGEMCLALVKAGYDAWALRAALRAVEVKG